jgi:hypothetical protein
MSEKTLATTIAAMFLVANFFTIFLVVAMHALSGFTFDEMTTTIAILIPVFLGYSTVIIKFASSHRDSTKPAHKDNIQTFLFTFAALFVCSMFIIAIIALVLMRAFNFGVASFEQFKILLGLTQSAFAAYVGIIVSALFSSDNVRIKGAARIDQRGIEASERR